MSRRRPSIFGARVFLLALLSASLAAADQPGVVFFESQVRPLLIEHCFKCHGGEGGKKLKGNLFLASRAGLLKGGDTGPAIKPGDVEHSLLVTAVRYANPDLKMPPDNRLSDPQVATLEKWIQMGAPWSQATVIPAAPMERREDFWSLKPVVRPRVPEVADQSWPRNEIDHFIAARLEKERLHPSPMADRTALLRRVYFDLTGLPPTPAEVDAYLSDRSSDAYERVVDRLLASPRYGERWGRHWLDVVRYADSNGFEVNKPRPNAWPYRDYVIRSFNNDEPYDQFVREQLAGDRMGAPEATGYLVAGSWDEVKSPDPVLTAQQWADELHDMASTTGTTFLGLTVGCARCHDHKFDAITQEEYYRLTAVFAGVQHGERSWTRPCDKDAERELAEVDAKLDRLIPMAGTGGPPRRPAVVANRNVERFEPVKANRVRFAIMATRDGTEPCIDELEVWLAGDHSRNVARSSAGGRVTVSGCMKGNPFHTPEHLIDGRSGNSWSWISDRPGTGWVQVELPGPVEIDRVVWGRDRERRYMDRVPSVYRIEIADERGVWKLVASSADRVASTDGVSEAVSIGPSQGELARWREERAEALRRVEQASRPVTAYAGFFLPPTQTHRLQRGDPMQPREAVRPGGIEAVAPRFDVHDDLPDYPRRDALGKWITDPANPLTARVMVNRLWHYHFGRGIVSTPGDFGHMGARPTHPELLDWLASEFVAGGWKIKPMQRLILLSATYRQSAAANAEGLSRDADATLLWRFPSRRLEAEEIRDAMLQISRKLDLTMGGPGFEVFVPDTNYVHVYKPKQSFTPTEWRRMVYQQRPRLQPDPTFGVFDSPDGAQVTAKRTSSTTPLQSLNLLNSPFVMEQSAFMADRLRREAGDDPGAQVTLAFRLAFSRGPNDAERAAGVEFVRGQGLVIFCRAIFSANELVYVF